jgi:hypothetical protein
LINIHVVAGGKTIQVDLIKLLNGERLIRLTEAVSGLSLEKKLDPGQSVVRQKQRLLDLFEAVLLRAEAVSA